jgi:dihydrofolate reductase
MSPTGPSLIALVAVDDDLGIGRAGALPPWHLADDLRRFRQRTMGRPLLMGRLTHESIGRALPGRRNLVVSASGRVDTPGVDVFPTLEAALAAVADAPEVAVVGGAHLYATLAPRLDTLHLTHVHGRFDADTHLRRIPIGCWTLDARTHYPTDARNSFACDVYELRRDPAAAPRGELDPGSLVVLGGVRVGEGF